MTISNEFGFIGWNTQGTSDKVWGYFYRPTVTESLQTWNRPTKHWNWNCCIFWGRRGKALRFKADLTGHELDKIKTNKMRDGYVAISQKKLLEIWPTFIEEAESKLMWEVLAGKIT